jgi:hypothetical protein
MLPVTAWEAAETGAEEPAEDAAMEAAELEEELPVVPQPVAVTQIVAAAKITESIFLICFFLSLLFACF